MVRVAQAGENLVLDVPRRPQPVQIERLRADVSLADLLEDFFAAPALLAILPADVAVAVLVLNLLQLRDDVIGALLEARVAGRREHVADGREVVTGDVPRKLLAARAVPPAVTFIGLGLQARLAAQGEEHPVRLELEEILRVEVLRPL